MPGDVLEYALDHAVDRLLEGGEAIGWPGGGRQVVEPHDRQSGRDVGAAAAQPVDEADRHGVVGREHRVRPLPIRQRKEGFGALSPGLDRHVRIAPHGCGQLAVAHCLEEAPDPLRTRPGILGTGEGKDIAAPLLDKQCRSRRAAAMVVGGNRVPQWVVHWAIEGRKELPARQDCLGSGALHHPGRDDDAAGPPADGLTEQTVHFVIALGVEQDRLQPPGLERLEQVRQDLGAPFEAQPGGDDRDERGVSGHHPGSQRVGLPAELGRCLEDAFPRRRGNAAAAAEGPADQGLGYVGYPGHVA